MSQAASYGAVASLPAEAGDSLKGDRKTREGAPAPTGTPVSVTSPPPVAAAVVRAAGRSAELKEREIPASSATPDRAWVIVGTDSDIARVAAGALCNWRDESGRLRYSAATDAGGSDDSRCRL